MVKGLLHEIGISIFSAKTRVGVAELSKYGTFFPEPADWKDPKQKNPEDRHIPIDVLFDAELHFGDPVVTRFLADLHDCDLVPRAGKPPAAEATIDAFLRAHKESSDVLAAYVQRYADGLDAADRDTIRREIDEAVAAMMDLRKQVSR